MRNLMTKKTKRQDKMPNSKIFLCKLTKDRTGLPTYQKSLNISQGRLFKLAGKCKRIEK